MHDTVKNLLKISDNVKANLPSIQNSNKIPKIIAVSKTFKMEQIFPLIEYGHLDFGENKVQEAQEKWAVIKEKNKNIKLHLIGRLQTNKVKIAIKLFDYIHSLDNKKLADKISKYQSTKNHRKIRSQSIYWVKEDTLPCHINQWIRSIWDLKSFQHYRVSCPETQIQQILLL